MTLVYTCPPPGRAASGLDKASARKDSRQPLLYDIGGRNTVMRTVLCALYEFDDARMEPDRNVHQAYAPFPIAVQAGGIP